MAALESKEGLALDLSSYRCIYISFGSKNQTKVKPFYQDFPYFLVEINKYPLCVLSIDDYPEFTKEERDVPYGVWENKDHPRQRYTHITIPSHSMGETIHITKQLVELLDKTEAQVFFVNFIKYRSTQAHDAGPETEARHIESHLGKFIDHYYHWYGFGSFHDFIIKNNEFFKRVYMILYSKDNKEKQDFLGILKNDDALIELFPRIFDILRNNAIDITPDITAKQIELLDPGYTGGRRTRKRRRHRRTKRR
jgi:hypothetical protein